MTEKNCSTFRNYRSPPLLEFFALYSVLSCAGILINALLLLIYAKHRRAVLGDRASFALLRVILGSLDFTITWLLVCNLVVLAVDPNEGTVPASIFYILRNNFINMECLGLILVAVDRLIAMRWPTTRNWGPRHVRIIFCSVAGITGIFDLIVRILLFLAPIYCPLLQTIYKYYLLAYGVTTFTSIVSIYFIYGFVFHSFRQHIKKIGTNHTKAAHPREPSSAPSGFHSVASHQVHEHISLEDPRRGSLQPRQTRRDVKMARILFVVTLVYTVTLMPSFINNAGFLPFSGYIIQYLFYGNALINAFIYIATNEEIRGFLKQIFKYRFCG